MLKRTRFVLILIICLLMIQLSVSALNSADTDSLNIELKKLPDSCRLARLKEIFQIKSKSIYANTVKGNNDEVLEQVTALKKLSKELNYPEGENLANQALADYYYKNGLRKESLSLCMDLFKKMEAENAPLARRIALIRQMQNMNGETIDTDTRIYYLNKLQGYINDCEQKEITELDEETSLSYVKYSYHRFYISVGYSLKDTALMYYHLQEAERMAREYQLKNEKSVLTSMRLNYYELSGQYEQAILLSNEFLEMNRKLNKAQSVRVLLSFQADLYRKAGRNAEAVQKLREYIVLNDSLGRTKYYNELARLKAQHDEDKQMLNIRTLELESSRIWIWKISTLLGILLITCASLIYIAYTRQRHNKQLKKAKEKSEESDRLKSSFLANINHEIRTPLNAIIGFSEILIDEKEEDLRRQYVDVIRENNGILQQLIEGILSVSRIESGSETFSYAKVALPGLMNEIFQSANTRVAGNVILDYISGPNLKMKTDQVHLSRILLSLLLFSIRRTQEGTVRFGYTLQEDKISFYIQNTSGEMSAEEQETLFDYNLMLKSWTKGVGLGVNLELAVAKNLTDRMGGSLIVNIKELNGFAFYVNLPYS